MYGRVASGTTFQPGFACDATRSAAETPRVVEWPLFRVDRVRTFTALGVPLLALCCRHLLTSCGVRRTRVVRVAVYLLAAISLVAVLALYIYLYWL